MVSRSQLSRPGFFFSSLVFLLIFILSGCNNDSDTSSTPQHNNQQPIAKITASLVSTAGKTVTLDGSNSSDPDGDKLSFRWEQMEGPDVTLSGVSTATLSFVAPTVSEPTQFTFELTVDDGDLSSTASVSFQLSPSDSNPDKPNQQPYAMITAPETATSGQTVTLNGSGSSDPDGDNLTYKWTQTQGMTMELPNSTSSTLTFVAPTVSQSTQFTFQLTVADGALSSTASVSIEVTPQTTTNQQPSAKITAPQDATSGQTVILNGSDSSDPDGSTLSFQWKQTEGPEIMLSNSSSSSLTFVAPAVTQTTQFTFQLTVHDGELSNSASVSMQISPMGGNTSPTCATAEENNSLTLSCPSGEVITEVKFASYGNPGGECGSFTVGSCSASDSVTVVSDACKGKNSCALYAGSDTFGNPCEGTAKKLAAEVACGMETDPTTDPNSKPRICILPIGDSITESNRDHLSFRYPLWEGLVEAGYEFDFVGSNDSNHGGSPNFPNDDFDRDHEGHWGWRVDEILKKISGWLDSYTPDVALVHLGTNDAFQSQSTDSTIDELKQLIGHLRGDNERVVVLLAKLIPSTRSTQSNIEKINARIDGLAGELTTDISPVVVVDQSAGYDGEKDNFDGIHPNETGEQKMADKWIKALEDNWPTQGGACAQ